MKHGKHWLRSTFMTTLLLVLLAGGAFAADLGKGRVDVNSVLNVRTGPSTQYRRVDTLKADTVVLLTEEEGGWYHISYGDGQTGWVCGRYIRPLSEPSQEDTDLGEAVVAYAKTFLGTPYVWGGNGPDQFDCSGYTKYIYAHFGYSIWRTASTQLQYNGVPVSRSELQPGDLVFFRNPGETKACSHVGIYIGGQQFIHASSGTGMCVKISSFTDGTYEQKFVGARRIL